MKQTAQFEELGFQWLTARINDISSCRGLVHHSPLHCFSSFIEKLLATGQLAVKYYLLFHAIPLTLKLIKCKTVDQALRIMKNTALDYSKSVLFLSCLVALERASLCLFLSQAQSRTMTSPKVITLAGLMSSIAILFEEGSRRREIVYFVSAKALRSAYLIVKRTLRVEVKWEAELMHCVLMAGVYYTYNHLPQMLKFRKLFELILGDS